jgi:hypothetical protein
LAAQLIQQKNPLNNFEVSLSQDRKSANIRFEFINPSEGVVIQVVHTGIKSSDLSVSGTIADTGPIKRTYGGEGDSRAAAMSMRPLYVCLLLGVLLAIFAMYIFSIRVTPDPEFMRLPSALRGLLTFAVTVIASLLVGGEIVLLNRVNRLPKGFDKYDETFDSVTRRSPPIVTPGLPAVDADR